MGEGLAVLQPIINAQCFIEFPCTNAIGRLFTETIKLRVGGFQGPLQFNDSQGQPIMLVGWEQVQVLWNAS